VKFSFKPNYRVVVLSPTDTVDNPFPGCIAVYLEASECGLQFVLPNIVIEILQTYDITVA